MTRNTAIVWGILTTALLTGAAPAAQAQVRIMMLHHSTGRNLLAEGDVRVVLQQAAGDKAPAPALWDHDYNPIGLSGPSGAKLGYSFNIPDDNTDPDGLHKLWTTDNAARDSLLSRFDVIVFKSCYEPTNLIRTDDQLQQYKTWYLEIRDVLDQHPDKVFVLFTPPALTPLWPGSTVEWADRARNFANWMKSDTFLAGHPNLRVFDFFDVLANPDDGSPQRNMLRQDFLRNYPTIDGHPNALANQTAAPLLVQVLMEAASVPTAGSSWGGLKALNR